MTDFISIMSTFIIKAKYLNNNQHWAAFVFGKLRNIANTISVLHANNLTAFESVYKYTSVLLSLEMGCTCKYPDSVQFLTGQEC